MLSSSTRLPLGTCFMRCTRSRSEVSEAARGGPRSFRTVDATLAELCGDSGGDGTTTSVGAGGAWRTVFSSTRLMEYSSMTSLKKPRAMGKGVVGAPAKFGSSKLHE